jgi:hypothetical protein
MREYCAVTGNGVKGEPRHCNPSGLDCSNRSPTEVFTSQAGTRKGGGHSVDLSVYSSPKNCAIFLNFS